MSQLGETCEACHSWQRNHPDLPADKRNGLYGMCMSPWRAHHIQHESSCACLDWVEREPERQQRQCPGCGATVWRWLTECPECGHDLTPKRRRVKMERPTGRREHGWLRFRRALHGY